MTSCKLLGISEARLDLNARGNAYTVDAVEHAMYRRLCGDILLAVFNGRNWRDSPVQGEVLEASSQLQVNQRTPPSNTGEDSFVLCSTLVFFFFTIGLASSCR